MKTIIDKNDLTQLKNLFPTPFYIYDEKAIRENLRQFLNAFSWNKGFKEYFAIKANPNPAIIKILKEEGCGVDCSSYTELMLADALGFDSKEIFFSSNNTPKEDFVYAKQLNSRINLDDYTHIDFLDNLVGIPEEICCRYNPGGDFIINNRIMDNPKEAKYGFTYEQIVKGYKKLIGKGVKKLGIHSFLASNCLDNDYYPLLAKTLFNLCVCLKKEHEINISFINLSGGIGIPYLPKQNKVDINLIGEKIKGLYEKILVNNDLADVQLCSELGRYITGPFGQLVTTVTHKKDTYKNYIGVDACAVHLMRPAMYGAYHHISVLGKENEENSMTYDVVGSLCENNDKFAVNRKLPYIDVGDTLVIHDAGAHGYSMGYNYNGKLRCAEILKKADGTFGLIRRAETPKDYFATLNMYDLF